MIQFTMEIMPSEKLDYNDIEEMERRFMHYLETCAKYDMKIGNQAAYAAIGIDKGIAWEWVNRCTTNPARTDFIKKVQKVCALYREGLMQDGKVNPVTGIFWQKNYDGMEDTAKDDRHGYCQTHRWGEDGDYDCSSAVYTAWEHAGIPVKTYSFEKYGCAYTGVMLAVFKHFGFEDVTNKVNLATGAGLKRSDILLNDKHHVAMYCGNGMEVEASINEKGTATGGTPGDQTGKEFLIRAYRNYPWNHVLRYPDGGSTSVTKKSVDEVAKEVLAGAWGNGDARKNALTAAGYNYSEVQAAVNRLVGGKTTTPTKSITEVAKEVLAGKWGNGDNRKKKLEAAGYNYSQVQAKVNELAKGSTSSKKSVTQIAKEVIAGKWGNGTDRKNKLTAAGYDYTAVQREVNRLL